MHNRPDNARHWGRSVPRVPAGSGVRLVLLFAGWSLLLAAIAGRAAWLQTAGRDRFITLWDRTTERLEPIPARNGRIVTADGQVLAYDEPQFAVAVHYRWLEEPPDAAWLKSQALARLASGDRRNSMRIESATAEVIAQRQVMHASLAVALGLSAEQLQERFRVVQERVERIVASVEQRRVQNESATPAGDQVTEWGRPLDASSLWELICEELTTPPRRPQTDPLVVAEELEYHEILASAPLAVIGQIESFPQRFPGVDVRQTMRRVYPLRDRAAHLVGVRTPLQPEEWTARQARYPGGDPLGYRAEDALGRSGIEAACDESLHGAAGVRRIVTNRQGEILQQEVLRPAVHGRDVPLTIDGRLQQQAEALLDAVVLEGRLPQVANAELAPDSQSVQPPAAVGGCLVALDVRTGAILAAAASPRYDAQLLVSATTEEWNATANDPRRPFFPRVTQATLPPGSVFKTITAIAGLEAGVINPEAPFDCAGYLERPDRERCALFRHFGVGHGPVALDEALAQSCNVYFYDVARRLGPQPIVDWARRFGCGASTGCDLPGELVGHLPDPNQLEPGGERWYPGTTRQLAIGQARLTVTPLQTARLMAAIANNGWLVTPHCVDQLPSAADEEPTVGGAAPMQLAGLTGIPATSLSPLRIPELSAETLAQIRAGLLAAVEHPRGTGREALLKGVRIAGKTGTAEIGGGRPDHAWFAGFAPVESPRIAFVVVVEQGGSGGRVAAPVAREFVRAWSELGRQPQPGTAAR